MPRYGKKAGEGEEGDERTEEGHVEERPIADRR